MANPGSDWGGDDDDEKEVNPLSKKFDEFDCPDCNANNPWDPPITTGDEVLCNYCGSSFVAKVTDEGKLKLKSL